MRYAYLYWGLILFFIITANAQEPERAALFHSGEFGSFFREYRVPDGTLFAVTKSTPEQLRQQIQSGSIRLVLTTVPPVPNAAVKVEKFAFKAPILAVHPTNRLRNISLEDARAILEQNTGSWRSLGGPLARIHLYLKAGTELPRAVMTTAHPRRRDMPKTIYDLPPLGNQPEKQEKKIRQPKYNQPLKLLTDSDSKSFSLLCTDPQGMACFDITRYDEDRVPLLAISNIPPTLDNFRAGSYPLLTTCYLISPKNPTPAETALLRYLKSSRFAFQLYQAGWLPFFQPTEKTHRNIHK